MDRISATIGFSGGAFLWIPIAAIVLANIGPGISATAFWRSFAGGFLGVPATIGAIILVIWITRGKL